MRFYRIGRIGVAAAVLALAGCAKADSGAAAVSAKPAAKVASGAEAKPFSEFFPLTVGGKTLRAQVAVLDHEKQRGLMERRDLGENDGMIFIFPFPQQMSFWMRNTPTPLDIAYITPDGAVGEVYPMYPHDETAVRSKGEDYTLALEMNQGWFAKNELKPGAKLDLAQLAAALRARGFVPERYAVKAE